MLKTYRIIPTVFILFLFGLTFITVPQVFAQGGAQQDQQIQSLQSEIQSLKRRIEALETSPTTVSNAQGAGAPAGAPLRETFDYQKVEHFLNARRNDRHTRPVHDELKRCYEIPYITQDTITEAMQNRDGYACICDSPIIDPRIKRSTFLCP